MDRMITLLKRIPVLIAVVLLVGLVAGCPVGHIDDIADSTPPAAPGTPVVVPGDTQLAVSRSAVSHATGYDVFWHTVDNSAAIPGTNTASTTTTSATITSLLNGTAYYVWVKAKNEAGSSGFSPAGSGIPVSSILQEHTPTSANSTSNFIGDSSNKMLDLGSGLFIHRYTCQIVSPFG